jgi:hypothetical protein
MLKNLVTVTIKPLDNGYEIVCSNPNEVANINNAANPANRQILVALDYPSAAVLAGKFLSGVADPAANAATQAAARPLGQPVGGAAVPPTPAGTP